MCLWPVWGGATGCEICGLPWLPSHLVADSLAVGMDQWDMTLVPVRCPESWRMKLLGCVSELSKDLLESLCLFDILTPKFLAQIRRYEQLPSWPQSKYEKTGAKTNLISSNCQGVVSPFEAF